MGMFDIACVCPNCRKVSVIPVSTTKCPGCGSVVTPLGYTSKKWQALSEEEQQAAVDKALGGLPSMEGSPFEETEHAITTTDRFDNAEITAYLGTVSGTDIYLVGGVMGGGLANQENLFGGAFASAKTKMLQKAMERGGNAVVGMSVNVTSPGNLSNIIAIVTGTAGAMA